MKKIQFIILSFITMHAWATDELGTVLHYNATLVDDKISLSSTYKLQIQIGTFSDKSDGTFGTCEMTQTQDTDEIYYLNQSEINFSNEENKNGDISVSLNLAENYSNDPAIPNFKPLSAEEILKKSKLCVRTLLISTSNATIQFDPVRIMPIMFALRSRQADVASKALSFVPNQPLSNSDTGAIFSKNSIDVSTLDLNAENSSKKINAKFISGQISEAQLPQSFQSLVSVANSFSSIFSGSQINGNALQSGSVTLNSIKTEADSAAAVGTQIWNSTDQYGTSDCTGNRYELMYKTPSGAIRCIKCIGTMVVVWGAGAQPKCEEPTAYYQ